MLESRHWKGGPISALAQLLEALQFAAHKHRAQRRKDADASSYINHPLEVTTILATTGAINDLATLLAAVLHDTIEDTETTPEELEEARLIKLGDKIANVHDVTATPPADWSLERRRDYLDWTEQVVRGCRGSSPSLERRYDEGLRSGRAVLEARPRGPGALTG